MLSNWVAFVSTIIFIILVFFLFVYLFKDKFMFMPGHEAFPIEGGEWVEFGPGLSGYLIKRGGNKVVIYSHGNGGNLTWYTPTAYRLAEKSDVFLYDYPGYGYSKGTPNEQSVLNSGLEAYDYINSLGYKKIYCYGFSLG